MTKARWLAAAGMAAVALTAAACGERPERIEPGTVPAPGGGAPATGGGGAPAAAALPADLFVPAAPAAARGVLAVKKDAKEGDTVVIRGKVGGSTAPFLPGRAVVSIVETEGVVSCEKMPDDHCPTPWDYCCEDPARLVEATATVQVPGDDGRPLRAALEGAGGLRPLKIVVVEGVVAARPDPKVLVVNAKRIHVEP